jgi:hypothetical protein
VTGFGASGRSQHSTDQLISELIQTTRTAEATEIVTIIQHISQAGFNAEMRAVPRRDRGYSYQGYRLGVQAPRSVITSPSESSSSGSGRGARRPRSILPISTRWCWCQVLNSRFTSMAQKRSLQYLR